MFNEVKISSFQLFAIITGFMFGALSTLNYLSESQHDVWMVFLIGWGGGFAVMGLYVYIAALNPGKTLVGMLKDSFGKVLGSLLTVCYIWYFLHIAAITMRIGGEYLVGTSYQQTPSVFIYIISFLVVGYIVKKGLEPLSRLDGIYVAVTAGVVAVIFFTAAYSFDWGGILPVLQNGIKPVLKESLNVFAFPFGEGVIFLMFFPFIDNKGSVAKPAFYAVAAGGFLSFAVIFVNLLVLGPHLLSRSIFPLELVAGKTITDINIDPLVTANFAIATGIRMMTCLFAASTAIKQLFNFDDHRFVVWPLSAIIVVLTTWLYDNVFQLVNWAENIYFYYALPFQVVIPLMILAISLLKGVFKKKSGNKKGLARYTESK